jgi:hypothetical protein
VEADKQLPVPGQQGWSEHKDKALGPSTELLNSAACGSEAGTLSHCRKAAI